MTPALRPVDATRLALGAVLAVRPGLAAVVLGDRPTGTTDTVVRILAARLLGQALIGSAVCGTTPGRDGRRLLVGVDVGVEAVHGLSMVALAAAVPARWRMALAGGVLAALLAALELARPGGGS